MVKRWSIGANDIYRDASLHIQEMPMWAFLLDEVVGRICGEFPAILLPTWPQFEVEGEESTNPKEWFGDTRQMFHAFVCTPIWEFCESKSAHKTLRVDYDEVEREAPEHIVPTDYDDEDEPAEPPEEASLRERIQGKLKDLEEGRRRAGESLLQYRREAMKEYNDYLKNRALKGSPG